MRALGQDITCETDVVVGQLSPRPRPEPASAGPTLGAIADACRSAGKRLPPGLVLSAVHDAALELAVVHASVGGTHGLICDQSIAIDLEGTARLVDEGLFRSTDPHHIDAAMSARVAPWRAPEQLLRGQFPDARSDVYSLAAVLHEQLSGRRVAAPRGSGVYLQSSFLPPSAFNLALGPPVDEVVMRALSADPSQRYATAVDFAVALRRAAAGLFWRPALRAQFVASLFPDWHERQVVIGVLIPLPVRRAAHAPAPAPVRNAERAPVPELEFDFDSEPEFVRSDEVVLCEPFEMAGDFDDWDEDREDDWYEARERATRTRTLALALIAVCLGGLWQAHLPLWDYERLGPQLAARVSAWRTSLGPDAVQVEAAPRRALQERRAGPPPPRVAEAAPKPAAEPVAEAAPAMTFGFVREGRCGADPVPPLRAAPCPDATPRLKAVTRPVQTVKRKAAGKHRAVAQASRPRRGRAR